MDLILAGGFVAFMAIALFVDLFWLKSKGSHVVAPREALFFTAMWVGFAVLFGIGVWFEKNPETAITFFTGYLVEYSLSIDNVFVFTMVFAALKTPKKLQQKALIYGIIISLVLRFAMILVGTALVERFEVVLYGFGIFLLVTGIQMLRSGGHMGDEEPGAIRFAKRFIHECVAQLVLVHAAVQAERGDQVHIVDTGFSDKVEHCLDHSLAVVGALHLRQRQADIVERDGQLHTREQQRGQRVLVDRVQQGMTDCPVDVLDRIERLRWVDHAAATGGQLFEAETLTAPEQDRRRGAIDIEDESGTGHG